MTIVDELRKDRENGARRLEGEYRAGLMTLARRFCSDEGDAEELVNRTFAAVVSGIDDYLEQSAFFGWMCQIMSNLHGMEQRRKSRQMECSDPAAVDGAADAEGADRIVQGVDASLLREAIEELPREDKEVLLMHYFMDLPVARIARILSAPEGTVKWRLHGARLALGAKLGAVAKKPGGKALLIALALAAITAAGAATSLAVVRFLSPAPAAPSLTTAPLREGGGGGAAGGSTPTAALNRTGGTGETEEASGLDAASVPLVASVLPVQSSFETDSSTTQTRPQEQIMNTATLRSIAAAAAFATASSSMATEALFKNTTGDGDLANTANWDPSSWAPGDSLTVSTANFGWPASGLFLSGDMPQSASLKFGAMPNQNVEVDFGGRNLNVGALYIGDMHDNANRGKYLKATGGFSGVGKLFNMNKRGNIHFYDGVYSISNGLSVVDWYPEIHVCSGAELVFENLVGDGLNTTTANGVCFNGSVSGGAFIIDGGKVVTKNRNNERWCRTCFIGNTSTRSSFTVKNGGEYRDDTGAPANEFFHVNFTVKDAGYYETNSWQIARNTGFFGASTKYEITNSVFRAAQLYCGPYQVSGSYDYEVSNYSLVGSTVDFCNSEVTFAFAPRCTKTSAGVIMPATAKNNTFRFRGDANRFISQTFVLGGSNTVAVTGGRFDVSNSFGFVAAPAGSGSTLLLKDADIYLKTVTASATASNTVVDVSGSARVKGAGNFATGGPGSTMRVADNAVVAIGANRFSLQGDGSTLFLGGLASTGSVSFAANDCTAIVAGTTHRAELGPGWTRVKPFDFTAGNRNNVLVISNATYSCNGPAYKDTVRNENDELGFAPRPFTGCPGCRIEFRGSSPKFVVTSSKESVSNGVSRYAMAFGEMLDTVSNLYTQEPYRLDNPVRLRYVIPPSSAPYAEAPVQSTVTSRETAVVLGGNAEFEFDMSEYDWPIGKFTIPLVYDVNGFTVRTATLVRPYIDVDQLNLTNAARMPVNKYGQRAGKLALSDDGKTLNLVISNSGATMIILK